MHDKLAAAIVELTRELKESREERRKDLVTKRDLSASEARIISAVKGVSVEEAERITASLRKSNDAVTKAIAAQSQ